MMDLRRFGRVLGIAVLGLASVAVAQGPPGRDRNNPPPGHGGVPPGQAKKGDYGDHHREYQGGRADFHFRDQDRGQFYSHYRNDADRWRGRRRVEFRPGERILPTYRVQPVPQTYWRGAPPPPPGYQYGYYQGYVVAYNPTTRIIGDVLDLVSAATSH
jgi:hypothetical protein